MRIAFRHFWPEASAGTETPQQSMDGLVQRIPSPALRTGNPAKPQSLPALNRTVKVGHPALSIKAKREGFSTDGAKEGRRIVPTAKRKAMAMVRPKVETVRPWGELTVEYQIEGEGRKSDFIGLYNEDGRPCGEGLTLFHPAYFLPTRVCFDSNFNTRHARPPLARGPLLSLSMASPHPHARCLATLPTQQRPGLGKPGSKGQWALLTYRSTCDFTEDYDASLLTKGRAKGSCTFIAPLEEGQYYLKLVRGDKEALASAVFRVITQKLTTVAATSPPHSPVANRKIIKRFDSPTSVIDVPQHMKGTDNNGSLESGFAHLAR